MRTRLGFLAVFLLSACTDGSVAPPQNCAEAKANFWECFDRFKTVEGNVTSFDQEGMWYACFPHSEPKRIEGWWATDIEMNTFFEDQEPTVDEVLSEWTIERAMLPNLYFKRGVKAPEDSANRARLWAVTLIGREETCQLFPTTPPLIYVEKVLTQKLVWEAQGYPTYTGEKFTE